jgi:integrase
MATIIEDHKGRSPYWIAVISTVRNGRPRRIWKSTKVRHTPLPGDTATKKELRLKAEEIARAYELDIRRKDQNEVTARNLRRLLGEIEGQPVTYTSVRKALEDWLASSEGSISAATKAKYVGIKNTFLEWLGPRAQDSITTLKPKDFLDYRNYLLSEGRTPRAADLVARKILNIPLGQQLKLGTIQANPIASVPPLKTDRITKGTFTPEEIARLLKACADDPDWKGAILVGYFTGARLQDVCNLRWDSVDLAKKVISFRAGKTDQAITIAIHPELEDHLLPMADSDDPKGFLFPSLTGKRSPVLSANFKEIMAKASIEAGVAREKLGAKGRTISLRSWHSLRHSFNSALANQGVSQELRQKLTGHSSAEMNTLYTHHELETIRRAVAAIPRLPEK